MGKSIPLFDDFRRAAERLPRGRSQPRPFAYAFWDGSNEELLAFCAEDDRAVVCDSSAFRRERPEFARNLLQTRAVAVPTGVVDELQPLRADPSAHPLCAVVFEGDRINPRVVVTAPPPSTRILQDYYAALIAERKHAIGRSTADFVRRTGHEPNPDERAALVRGIGRYGPRTAQLAAKFDASGALRSTVDEAVVALGLALALVNERNTIILTADHDLLEQFYKLTSLLRDDLAAHLLAKDFLRAPQTYGPRRPLPEEMMSAAIDPAASFLIERPRNLDYLFAEPLPTREIMVACVGDGGHRISWHAPLSLADFLREKTVTWRNTRLFGTANAYISLPFRDAERKAYAFFIADGAGDRDGASRRVPRADMVRAIFDHERFDLGQAAAATYHHARRLAHAGNFSGALDAARKLANIGTGRERLTPLGHARAMFAAAAYQEELNPQKAVSTYRALAIAYADARAPALREIVAASRLNIGRAQMRAGDLMAALETWGKVEVGLANDANAEVARVARAAGLLRAINYRFADPEGALSACERFQLHLGWPPRDHTMYGMAMYCVAHLLLDAHDLGRLRSTVAELLRAANETPEEQVDRKAALIEDYASIAVAAQQRVGWAAARPLLVDVIGCAARQRFSVRHLCRTTEILAPIVDGLAVRDLVTAKRLPNVGPRCRCCPPSEWARGDFLTAKLQALAGGPGVGAIWFRRVREVYDGLKGRDSLIADVVWESSCELEASTSTEYAHVRQRRVRAPSSLDGFAVHVQTRANAQAEVSVRADSSADLPAERSRADRISTPGSSNVSE